MEKILFRILVAVGIYLLFLISRTFYLWWKYIKERNAETKFVSFLKKDDTLRDLSWILPLVFIPLILVNAFRTNLYFVVIMCLLTSILGIATILLALRKNQNPLVDEEMLKQKKVVILSVLSGILGITYFWAKYFFNLVSPFYSVFVFTTIILVILVVRLMQTRKKGYEIKSMPGFYGLVGFLLFSIIVIVLNWIYS
ncbi:MAG: hypothetical protein Q8S39_05910 [Ignavibacteria bacterium]|nr:hypothetical protein [Ignavibacteria bacterium]